MKTIQPTANTTEATSNKAKQLFTALAFAALLVTAAGGGAAGLIYHEFAKMPTAPQASAHGLDASQWAATEPMARPATAAMADHTQFRNVDNTVLPPAAARRVIAAWRSNPVYVANVPPPLEKPVNDESQDTTGNRPPLTDPDSKYIVSATTGRVVGVDGSAGAAAEARLPVAPVAVVAIQTPPPEIRVASAVQVRAAIPVSPDDADASYPPTAAASDDVQYVPVRRAQPVTSGRNFNAASFLASDEGVPVVRGQVVNPVSRAAGFRRDFQLPDRSR